ncbi:MAG: helix-turn-helix domain-containing protein [Pseudomonadota bacterium]
MLSRSLQAKKSVTVRVQEDDGPEFIELPAAAVEMLLGILAAMKQGRNISITNGDTELTTAQAANVLRVSRPFLIKLLEKGEIPYHKVGTHRRIRVNDVMIYKVKMIKERNAILDQLAVEEQKLGIDHV